MKTELCPKDCYFDPGVDYSNVCHGCWILQIETFPPTEVNTPLGLFTAVGKYGDMYLLDDGTMVHI